MTGSSKLARHLFQGIRLAQKRLSYPNSQQHHLGAKWWCQRDIHSSVTRSLSEKVMVSGSGCVSPLPASNTKQGVPSGQPTAHSHPHLLNHEEVTVGITTQEYRDRRASLIASLGRRESGHHVLVLPATPRRYMIDKIPYLYRQDTDFLWSCGCLESDCVLVLHTLPGTAGHRAVMFCPQQAPLQLLWDGPRTHHDHAPLVWGVDEGLPMSELIPYLSTLDRSLSSPTLWYQQRNPTHPATHALMQDWLSCGRSAGLQSPTAVLHRLRLIKSHAEQRLMRTACRISAEAVKSTIAWTRPGLTEHQVFAKVDYECRVRGANYMAFPPVVAGGDRANIVHNINNNQLLQDGELLLMDSGGEYHGYSGDVTRTWPVNGQFTGPQRELFEAVLHVHGEVVRALRGERSVTEGGTLPGRNGGQRPSLDQLYRLMCAEFAKVLQELGVVKSTDSREDKIKVAMTLCPHHVSHYLGMDVHDTPSVSRNEPLQPGTVVTVEPGLYVPLGCSLAPHRYHGMGIRLEDDVLVTSGGCELLSDDCPRHADDIEALMKGGPLVEQLDHS